MTEREIFVFAEKMVAEGLGLPTILPDRTVKPGAFGTEPQRVGRVIFMLALHETFYPIIPGFKVASFLGIGASAYYASHKKNADFLEIYKRYQSLYDSLVVQLTAFIPLYLTNIPTEESFPIPTGKLIMRHSKTKHIIVKSIPELCGKYVPLCYVPGA